MFSYSIRIQVKRSTFCFVCFWESLHFGIRVHRIVINAKILYTKGRRFLLVC